MATGLYGKTVGLYKINGIYDINTLVSQFDSLFAQKILINRNFNLCIPMTTDPTKYSTLLNTFYINNGGMIQEATAQLMDAFINKWQLSHYLFINSTSQTKWNGIKGYYPYVYEPDLDSTYFLWDGSTDYVIAFTFNVVNAGMTSEYTTFLYKRYIKRSNPGTHHSCDALTNLNVSNYRGFYPNGTITFYNTSNNRRQYLNFTNRQTYPDGSAQFANQTSPSYDTTSAEEFWTGAQEDYKPVKPDTDPFEPGGTSGQGGGTGTFSDTGDIIGEPSLPTLSAVDTGFIQLFNPTLSQLNALASKLWSDDFFDNFIKAFENPMDVILGLSILPVAVPSSGAREVTAGNINTGVIMNVASTQYTRLDCGTLNVLEYWGCYLDYNPYTKCWIYLPYIGIKPLDIDVVMGHAVSVKYHIDILSGACVAMIFSDGTQVATWAGQCASLIPVNAQNYSNLFSGLLGSVAGIGTTMAGALSGNIAMAGAGGIGAVAAASSIAKIDCEKSGTINTTAGMLSVQTPYLIVERPRQARPAYQNTFTGYPSFITATLDELSGYTEVVSIHLNDIPATDEELVEIDKLLKEGVII